MIPSYETVFSRQVEGIGHEGDVISCNFNQWKFKNVINAVIAAKRKNNFNFINWK